MVKDKIMKLDTQPIEGCKVLHKIPKYLSEASIRNNDVIIEMGTLSNYKKFMVNHKDFRDSSELSSMRKGDDNFSGVANYDDFLELLNTGDTDVMKKIKVETTKQVSELAKKYEEVIHGYKFDVHGEMFDVGLVLTGVPEAWLEPDNVEEEKVRVEIIINGTFSAGVSKNDVINGASRILAIIKILEDNDVEVKLKIVSCLKNIMKRGRDNKNLFVATDIKDYDEPINYKKASALLSPTYLRRGMLKVMELVAKQDLDSSYGRPMIVKGFIDIHNNKEIDNLEKRLFKGE